MSLVLITGCARSGTSMVAGVLHASGLNFGGPLYMRQRPYQPRGFYEHRGVRELILKPLLRELGADPRGQRPLPPRNLDVSPEAAKRFRRRTLRELGKGTAYKDAKVLLTWQYWHAAFPDARWIIVRRDAMAIARSCYRTPFMRRRTYIQDWLHWVQQHLDRLEDLRAAGADVFEVWPDPIEPESFHGLLDHLGLGFDPERLMDALVPSAWHGGSRCPA